MKKILRSVTAILLTCVLVTGCGSIDATKDSNKKTNEKANQTENASGEEGYFEPEAPESYSKTIDLNEEYKETFCSVSVLGANTYKEFKTKKYTDRPDKGKQYFVVYLEVENRESEQYYFNVNYLQAEVDGKKVESTYLVNDPLGYKAIFENIAPSKKAQGFIVWQIPTKWKKFTFTYDGWKPNHGLSLNASFTKKDLKDPKKYEE